MWKQLRKKINLVAAGMPPGAETPPPAVFSAEGGAELHQSFRSASVTAPREALVTV